MPASQEPPAGTASSVLLVEEYDALAAALTSALEKFAPQHRTRVVESLIEAEAAAAEIHPHLLILDFDPPQPNAIEFFNRISAAHPDMRVLVMTSGAAPEFATQRYGPNAIQFVGKPFELADLGAAVQALLGPWTAASSGDSRGTLRDLNVRDLVPIECVSGATAVLKIVTASGGTGEIHFLNGHICHASAPGLSGNEALHEIMRWPNVRGAETERASDAPHTIHGPWLHVFLEALRAAKPITDEPMAPATPLPSREEPERAKTGKKIVVIDDTEMLLIFVEDSLSIADPTVQITTALTGSEGLRRTEEIMPDLVLLDYSLSDMRGDQVSQRLQQNEITARIPIIMMSGHVPEMMATAQRSSNVVATIAKPFMSEALIRLVNETLAQGSLSSIPPGTAASMGPKTARRATEKKTVKESSLSRDPTKSVSKRPSTSLPAVEVTRPVAKVPTGVTSQSTTSSEIRQAEPRRSEPSDLSPPPPRLVTPRKGTIVVRWEMEVISAQFTPRFQVGTIHVKPSATKLSLTQFQLPSVAQNHYRAGFEPGPVELDANGQIRTIRVRPTHAPADLIHIRNGLKINDVKLVNDAACIQFMGGSSAPMIMQLVGLFKLAGVELSDRFEVAQLILQPEGNRVRISLDPQARGMAGTEFETVGVRLDASARITEFILNPVISPVAP